MLCARFICCSVWPGPGAGLAVLQHVHGEAPQREDPGCCQVVQLRPQSVQLHQGSLWAQRESALVPHCSRQLSSWRFKWMPLCVCVCFGSPAIIRFLTYVHLTLRRRLDWRWWGWELRTIKAGHKFWGHDITPWTSASARSKKWPQQSAEYSFLMHSVFLVVQTGTAEQMYHISKCFVDSEETQWYSEPKSILD